MLKSERWLNLFFYSLVLLFATTLVVGSSRGRTGYSDYQSLLRSKEKLAGSMVRLRADVERLKTEIHKIKNSKSYAERVLKDKYHSVKERETIVFFAD